ncbi:MAG TPA: hypothetical protein VK045_09520 [Ornithinicoccus sp.]|nr:hypothetical protein [Ornithinicoccus sp.]
MTGTDKQHEGFDRELTQHDADDVREDWDVEATDPRPTGAGPGETPNAAAQGEGGRDGNLAGPGRFHEEQDHEG